MSHLKLPRLRKALVPGAPGPPAATAPDAPVLQVTAYTRSGLSDEEFSAQTAALRYLLEFDGGSRTWHARLSLGQPDRAAAALNGLFEAAPRARHHGPGPGTSPDHSQSADYPSDELGNHHR